MNREIITTKQGIFLVLTFTMGTSLIVSSSGAAKEDMWISIAFALIAILPVIFVYSKILSFFPGKNLYEILDLSFGKIIGKVFTLLYILYFLYLGSLTVRNITEFIQVVSLRQTPQYFSGLWIVLAGAYMVRSGIEVFARWTNLTCMFLLLLTFVTTIASIFQFDLTNILPILYYGWSPVIESTITTFSFPFGEVVAFLSLFHTLKENKNAFKTFFTGLFIGGILLMVVSIRSTFLLGYPLIDLTYFPTFYANTVVSIGGFVESIEVFSAVILLLAGFAKFSACLFAICIGIKHLFSSQNYYIFSIFVSLIALVVSQIMFSSTMEMIENVKFYPYYAMPFQVIFPIILLLFSWRKKKKMDVK